MKSVNVIVADANRDALKYNTDRLSEMDGIDIVASTMYGDEVIEKIYRNDVDVLVTDIMLKGIDGIGVLDALRGMDRPSPKPLILTRMDSEEVQEAVFSRGASYFMLKPASTSQLYDRIRMIAGSEKGLSDAANACSGAVGKMLKRMGVAPSMRGYAYLEEAVRLRMECGEDVNKLTEQLYPRVAVRFSTTAQCVERAIRGAIVSAWNSGSLQRYALEDQDPVLVTRRPTAGQMIEKLLRGAKENSGFVN